jgi:hypothetical protein
MSDQQPNAFAEWRRECEAIERDMNRLITAGRPGSEAERQVRTLQFASLIERREAAARKLMPARKPMPAAGAADPAATASQT